MKPFGVMIACLVWMSASWSLEAHHFKGFPHYNYFDNYPQVPLEEYLARSGRYEMSLVIYDFQGLQQEDMLRPDDVRFFVVLYDLESLRAWKGPLKLQLLDGGQPVETFTFAEAEMECLYRFSREVPNRGDYAIRVLLNGEVLSDIPFVLSSQKINWAPWVGATLFVLMLVTAYGARRARVAADRREQRNRFDGAEHKLSEIH